MRYPRVFYSIKLNEIRIFWLPKYLTVNGCIGFGVYWEYIGDL